MRALVAATLVLAACSGSPSRVRVQIGLGADAQALSAGPASLTVYTARGRLFENRVLNGKLPGDVVVLVDDDVGEVRVLVRAASGAVSAEAAGRVQIARGKEVVLPVTLAAGALPDSDGDGVPDSIDDCPSTPDATQQGACGGDDQSTQTFDFAGVDVGPPPDMAGNPCGNGTIDPGEACDNGAANSDDPASATATCTTACQKRAPCGAIAGGTAKIDPGSGHCYVLWPTAVAWAAAEKDCQTRGGHLAAVTSKPEDNFIKQLVNGGAAWLGVLSAPAGGMVTWSTGEANAYKNFAAGEPSMGDTACVIVGNMGNWSDRSCSWPAQGLLPAVSMVNAPYVCEHSCGNGVVDPGEECDPPAAGTCTTGCRKPRPCTEAGGQISPATGFCYFALAGLVDYPTAQTTCPAGTHLATPNAALETDTADKAIAADSWMSASTTASGMNVVAKFDAAGGPTMQLDRYHGFATPDPDVAAGGAAVVISHNAGQADGWRDRATTSTYGVICERETLP